MEDDPFDAYLETVRAAIEAQGLFIQYVGPAPAARNLPYAYTVGLTPSGRPELIVVNLSFSMMQVILSEMAVRTRAGDGLSPGDRHSRIVQDYDLAVVGPADDDSYPVHIARAVYPGAGPPVQVVWPDAAGRFPWQAGYDMNQRQPLLGPPPEPPGGIGQVPVPGGGRPGPDRRGPAPRHHRGGGPSPRRGR